MKYEEHPIVSPVKINNIWKIYFNFNERSPRSCEDNSIPYVHLDDSIFFDALSHSNELDL